jgi:hypothetical protein
MLVDAVSWVWGEMLNNIYIVLFIKGTIVLSVWPIYTLFVFRLTQCIHNKQIIQNRSLLFVFDLNCFNNCMLLYWYRERIRRKSARSPLPSQSRSCFGNSAWKVSDSISCVYN